MLDDPTAPTIYRTSGEPPYPIPHDPNPALPADVFPRQVTLRDRVTIATVVPFSSQHQVPRSLLAYLCEQLNAEIDMGDTYPMTEPMSLEKFSGYWFQNFGAVMLLGNIENAAEVVEGTDWTKTCLGSYYIKPNYPGRSSHVCNAGFLVTSAARNKGVGRLMGESYLDWAPRLGYTYSVFNLVYETNVASCRIWDALGFKRIGRVKGAGNMKSYPDRLIDAIIYGRDLGPDGSDFVSEERFDKIKFYLKHNKYPAGADRAEKSRLRSAATHYKLVPAAEDEEGDEDGDKLMLKDKEVISDPQKQYEIARRVHISQHAGINKTTATIAEKYHWVRIKETVSLVIKNCNQCKEAGKSPVGKSDGVVKAHTKASVQSAQNEAQNTISMHQPALSLPQSLPHTHSHVHDSFTGHTGQDSVSPQVLNRQLPNATSMQMHELQHQQQSQHLQSSHYLPLDPQMLDHVGTHLDGYSHHTIPPHDHQGIHQQHHNEHFTGHDADFHIIMASASNSHNHEDRRHDGIQNEVDANGDQSVDGDLDMLIDHGPDDGDLDGIEDISPHHAQSDEVQKAMDTIRRGYRAR